MRVVNGFASSRDSRRRLGLNSATDECPVGVRLAADGRVCLGRLLFVDSGQVSAFQRVSGGRGIDMGGRLGVELVA